MTLYRVPSFCRRIKVKPGYEKYRQCTRKKDTYTGRLKRKGAGGSYVLKSKRCNQGKHPTRKMAFTMKKKCATRRLPSWVINRLARLRDWNCSGQGSTVIFVFFRPTWPSNNSTTRGVKGEYTSMQIESVSTLEGSFVRYKQIRLWV